MAIPFLPPVSEMRTRNAFSLVEVAIALGILGFVVLTVVGLLSVGMKSNQVSLEETRAASLLTMLEADLRNTYPSLNAGKSGFFGLPLPYATNADGAIFNPTISSGQFSTTGINDSELPESLMTGRSRYQASVTYLNVPPAGSPKPVTARLVINWPGTNTMNATDVVDPNKVRGSVEAIVSFASP